MEGFRGLDKIWGGEGFGGSHAWNREPWRAWGPVQRSVAGITAFSVGGWVLGGRLLRGVGLGLEGCSGDFTAGSMPPTLSQRTRKDGAPRIGLGLAEARGGEPVTENTDEGERPT